MAVDPASLGKTVVEIAKALLGQLGPILLIASSVFLFLPQTAIGGIGLDNTQPVNRSVAGLLFILSAATCAFQIGRWLLSPLNRLWSHLRAGSSYRALGPEVKMGLAVFVYSHAHEFFLPYDSQVVQALLDSQNFFVERDTSLLRVSLKVSGKRLVADYRARIRSDVELLPEDKQRNFQEEVQKGQSAFEQGRASWQRI
jgi:hypothetical protein